MTKKLFLILYNVTIVLALLLAALWNSPVSASAYTEIEWVELIPDDDLEVLLNPPSSLFDVPEGSELDSFDAFQGELMLTEETQRFKQAMGSTKVVKTHENKPIRIPGFIVPLRSGEDKKVTEFFVVPYFGACLHMPPPPPNQIIYSSSKTGLEVEDLYEPFWFEGTLTIETNNNTLGTSAYRLILDKVLPYEDE